MLPGAVRHDSRRVVWWRPHPERVPKPVPLARRLFSGPRGRLRRPATRTSDAEVQAHMARITLETCPQRPNSRGRSRAGEVEDRLKEQAVTQCQWTASL